MKTIDIQEQPILSLGRTVKITANGIRYRLFRSLVTVVVVAVAVAFLMNILSESLIRLSIVRRTSRRVAELRVAAVWAGYLTNRGTLEEALGRLARAEPGGPGWREAAKMGGLSDPEIAACHEGARQAAGYLGFFAGLDYARRRALVHTAEGVDVFGHLREAAGMERFTTALAGMKSVRQPTTLEALRGFLERWPELEGMMGRVQRGRARAVEAVQRKLAGQPAIEALTEADGAFGAALREVGFVLDPPQAAEVAEQARRVRDTRLLEKSIGEPEMRKAVAGYRDLMPGDVNIRTLWDLLRDRGNAAWYLAKQQELGGRAAGLSVERATELAAVEAETRSLALGERIGAASGGLMGIGERMSWLVLASMLVCIVGISNAMLMSVTERFREIATLKCLGALDGFIMAMFVLEASFLGLVGGLVGAAAGCLLGLGRMLLPFGSLALDALPAGQLLAAMGASVFLGILLAAVASVYPSLKAARLAPMEAMRIQ